jgi:glycosyltransferase involved in cell wall biosynthesis
MRILYVLSNWLYPPDNGQKQFTFNLLKYMCARHDCDALGFFGAVAPSRHDLQIQIPKLNMLGVYPQVHGFSLMLARLKHLVRIEPLSLARYDRLEFERMLTCIVDNRNYDVIHFDTMNVAHYVRLVRNRATVLSGHDAYSLAYWRATRLINQPLARCRAEYLARAIEKFERTQYRHFTKVHVVSKIDRDYLLSLSPELDVESISLPVSQEFIQYPLQDALQRGLNKSRLLYSGLLSVPENAKALLAFLETSYLDILKDCPRAELIIIGRGASKKLARKIQSFPNVRFIPYVEDYLDAVANCTIFVIPLFGGAGVKTKVLQAMALAKPVVGTPDAFTGIDIEPGQHAIVCDSPRSFRDPIAKLLKDVELQKKIGLAGRELVLQNHAPEKIGSQMEQLYRAAISKARGQVS